MFDLVFLHFLLLYDSSESAYRLGETLQLWFIEKNTRFFQETLVTVVIFIPFITTDNL